MVLELDAAGAPAPKLKPVDVAGLAAADAPKPPKPVVDAGAVVLDGKLNGELVGAALKMRIDPCC